MSSNEASVSTCTSAEDFWCNMVKFHEAKFILKITDFTSLNTDGSGFLSARHSSPTNDALKWYSEFCFRGQYEETDHFRIYLKLQKQLRPADKVFVKSTFTVINDGTTELYTSCLKYSIFSQSFDDKYPDCIWRWYDFDSTFLQNDTLTIAFKIIYFEMNDIILASMFRPCKIIHFKQLSDNLASVFENRTLADFTISVNGKSYPVHKVILAARSTYFAKMFESGMKENQQNCVEITDVNEEIIGEMLKFIYTGVCENLDKLAADLLIVADKFDINHLKVICINSTDEKSLSVNNAVMVLILADQYNANELKLKAIDFIVSNSSEIMESETWNVILGYPVLLNSVCQAMRKFFLSKNK